ncbi:MAG: hypothetical protein F4231_07235, partial [Acidimicrobiaceae bacterium]|nr:hypothetical protein [Acidimicrobiaceae bacterium]
TDDRAVSLVAANPEVRAELVVRQREWVRRRGGGVVEGRDIGTVVFPDAEVKVHLVADPAVRAQRRVDQGSTPTTGDAAGRTYDEAVESVATDIARRDRIDSTRQASPLLKAPGAVVIDTTGLTFDETVEQVMRLL